MPSSPSELTPRRRCVLPVVHNARLPPSGPPLPVSPSLMQSTVTSLHWAAMHGHAPVVEFLLAGVDPNTRSQVGERECAS